jgi:hypothetical protein
VSKSGVTQLALRAGWPDGWDGRAGGMTRGGTIGFIFHSHTLNFSFRRFIYRFGLFAGQVAA